MTKLIVNFVIQNKLLFLLCNSLFTKVIDNKVYGQVVIKLPSNKKEINVLEKYLKLHKINFEEVNN